MFGVLQSPNVTWEATEAALFIMECVARNLDEKEEKTVPKVLEAILNLPEKLPRYHSTYVCEYTRSTL